MKGNEFLNRTRNKTKRKKTGANKKRWMLRDRFDSECGVRNERRTIFCTFIFFFSRKDTNLYIFSVTGRIILLGKELSMAAGNHSCIRTCLRIWSLNWKISCSFVFFFISIQFRCKQWIYNVIKWTYISFAAAKIQRTQNRRKNCSNSVVRLLWQCH